MGVAKRDHIRMLLAVPRVARAWRGATGHDPDETDVVDLYAAFGDVQVTAITEHGGVIPGVPEAMDVLRARGIVVGSTTGYVRPAAEAAAALARGGRIGRLSPAQVRRGVVDLGRIWGGLRRVPVDDDLAADAAELALAHDLRGFDAVHLAAANVSADTFVAADRRLLIAARSEGLSVADVAAVHWQMFDRLDLIWLWEGIGQLPRSDRWQTQARSAVRDDLLTALAELTTAVIESADGSVEGWLEANERSIARANSMFTEIRRAETYDLTTLSVALRQLRNLALTTVNT